MKKLLFFLLVSLGLLHAQPTNCAVVQLASTGVAIGYDAPDNTTPYTVKISTDPTFATVTNDVNSALFTSASIDLLRSGSIIEALHRAIQVGMAGKYWKANDTSYRSKTLQPNTTYYAEVGGVSCGSFTTSNLPLAINTSLTLPTIDPFTINYPTLNKNYQNCFNDATTGIQVCRFPDDGKGWTKWTGASGVSFDLAESSVWTATSGTLPAAIATNSDGIYIQTSTASSQLWIGLGDITNNFLDTSTKIPNDSTFPTQTLSYQNLLLGYDCQGTGCPADFEVAVTHEGLNGIESSPWKTITATTTPQTSTICHFEAAGVPCSTPNDPGDWLTWNSLKISDWKIGLGLVWNSGTCGGDYTRLCFKQQSDCLNRRVNETLRWWSNYTAVGRVTSLSCGSSPAFVTLDQSLPADNNGNTGVPFTWAHGLANNQHYGFLIRKKSVVVNATIRIDYARWIAASGTGSDCGFGAGGFHIRMQNHGLETPGGYNLMDCAGHIWGVKTAPDGTLSKNYLGFTWLTFPGLSSLAGVTNAENYNWSQTESGVFYVTMDGTDSPLTGTYGRHLIKVQFNHPDIPCGQPGTTCTLPSATPGTYQFAIADVTLTDLTPCLNSCTAAADDYTIGGQAVRLAGGDGYNPARWFAPSVVAIQGSTAILLTREAAADSFGWLFGFDLGGTGVQGTNYVGQHGNSQRAFAYYPTWREGPGRNSGFHTHQAINGPAANTFTVLENSAASGSSYTVTTTSDLPTCLVNSTCSPCPSVVVHGETLTGHNSCSLLSITSAWQAGWETQPSWWQPGDPVNNGGCSACSGSWHSSSKLRVGDALQMSNDLSNFEEVELVQQVSQTQWWVRRGCTYDPSFGGPKHYPIGTLVRIAFSGTEDCDHRTNLLGGASLWDFVNQPTGGGCSSSFTNHGFFAGTVRTNGAYLTDVLSDPTNYSLVCDNTGSYPVMPQVFAGHQAMTAQPNCVENHPGYFNFQASTAQNRSFWYDAHPLACNNGWTATLVTGSLYKVTSTDIFPLYPRIFPFFAWQGVWGYKRVNSIDGTSNSWGEKCFSVVANGCFTGSEALTWYLNGPLDTSFSNLCTTIEFWSGQLDTCVGNFLAKTGSAAARWRVPPNTLTSLSNNHYQTMVKDTGFRAAATANFKMDWSGTWGFLRSEGTTGMMQQFGIQGLYFKAPPFPADDGIDRTTYAPQPYIAIDPGAVPMGTSKALVEYGYDENFSCIDNSDEGCWAVSASLDTTTPFRWTSELTSGMGVSCASGCSIPLALEEGRIVRYRVRFVDSMGATLDTTVTSFDVMVIGSGGGGGGGGGGTPATTTGSSIRGVVLIKGGARTK